MTPDLLRDHYRLLVRHLEQLIHARIPRVPFLPTPQPLTDAEVDDIAAGFADGHRIAASRTGTCTQVAFGHDYLRTEAGDGSLARSGEEAGL